MIEPAGARDLILFILPVTSSSKGSAKFHLSADQDHFTNRIVSSFDVNFWNNQRWLPERHDRTRCR